MAPTDRDEAFPRPLGTWGVERERVAHQVPPASCGRKKQEATICVTGFAGAFVNADPGLVTIHTYTHTQGTGQSPFVFYSSKGSAVVLFAPALVAHIACSLYASP